MKWNWGYLVLIVGELVALWHYAGTDLYYQMEETVLFYSGGVAHTPNDLLGVGVVVLFIVAVLGLLFDRG